ncbi:MAG: 30S ribosomal protein S15 [Mycoplasmatales bacterium]|nr:30S ribosomal protein S15 [Mycoplasmatales bacterium]
MITKEKKLELIKKFGGSEKNTGDTAVQIAILTHDINSLSEHFAKNKKDLHSKRGFIAKIEKRKKLISYLKSQDFAKYQETIKALGIRK